MFQTHESAKINFPSEAGQSLWRYAELPVNQTWFLATCELNDGNVSISSTYLLSKSNQISELFSTPSLSISAVYMVSPAILNLQNSWKMDRLNKLSCGFFEDEGVHSKVEIYDLADGNVYYSNSKLKNTDVIKNITVVYEVDYSAIN